MGGLTFTKQVPNFLAKFGGAPDEGIEGALRRHADRDGELDDRSDAEDEKPQVNSSACALLSHPLTRGNAACIPPHLLSVVHVGCRGRRSPAQEGEGQDGERPKGGALQEEGRNGKPLRRVSLQARGRGRHGSGRARGRRRQRQRVGGEARLPDQK
eukprot:5320226-Pleurochrysis_carterae.AAC.1